MTRPFHEKGNYYESAEFTIATATTDYDVAANQTALFWGATSKIKLNGNWGKARGRLKLITDQTITLKYNATTNDGMTVTSSESPYIEADLAMTNLFVTNSSWNTCNLKIRLYII